MKTRINFYKDRKTANEIFKSRRKLMFAFDQWALQALPNPFNEHFGVENTSIEQGQDVSRAILIPILEKLQLNTNVDVDNTEIDVLEFTLKEKNIYYILIRMPSYRYSEGEHSVHIKGPVDLVYKVSKDNESMELSYDVISFETDRVDIYNLVTYEAEQRQKLINEMMSENEKKNEYKKLKRMYPKLHHEIRLKKLIDELPDAYNAIRQKAQNVLDVIHGIKSGNGNTDYIKELDDALRCTSDYLATLPLVANEQVDSILNTTYQQELGQIADKFKKSARHKDLGLALTALVTVSIITVCVLALVFSWGGAAIPIAAIFTVGCAASSFGFGLFYHAKDDKKVESAIRELQGTPQLS